jgi:hypothetical protein
MTLSQKTLLMFGTVRIVPSIFNLPLVEFHIQRASCIYIVEVVFN